MVVSGPEMFSALIIERLGHALSAMFCYALDLCPYKKSLVKGALLKEPLLRLYFEFSIRA